MWGERSIPFNPNRERSSVPLESAASNNDVNVNEGGGLRKLVMLAEEIWMDNSTTQFIYVY